MTSAAHESFFPRALLQSAFGHIAIFGLIALILFLSDFFHPVQPAEKIIEFSIVPGIQSAGEIGAPHPEAVHENAPPAPRPPDPPQQIKEPSPVKIEDTPKPPVVPKPPDKPIVKDVPHHEEPPKPEKHQVKVNTNKVITIAQNKPEPQPQNKPKKPQGTPLTDTQIKALLASGLPISKHGGAGIGGGPPGSIATGTPSGAMDLYKAALKARLYNAWTRPAGVEGLLTVIQISIARDGSIISMNITRKSGSGPMDESALQSVRIVRPAPLPPGADAPHQFDIEFDANGVSV